MLDLDLSRQGPTPRDASTLVVARDVRGGGIEVFCVERQKGGFLGGVVVFPGGKLEPSDLDPAWEACATAPRPTSTPIAADVVAARGLAIAACRETLEEAAILPVTGASPTHEELLAWRAAIAGGRGTLRATLAERGLRLDLGALHPLSRWVTPVSESRRFDTRFFLYAADGAVTGAHDDQETTASFWASPAEVLARHAAKSLVLAPPTHRTLEVLSAAGSTAEAIAIAAAACLEPIAPRVVPHRDASGDTIAIVLPGDPEHEVREVRIAGASRYVLREGRFWPEDPPA
jgi:8-oxo-dGTP pyrophosphatase MutT (NUDIX family)